MDHQPPLTLAEQRALGDSPDALERLTRGDMSWRDDPAFVERVRAHETKQDRAARQLRDMTERHARERAELERTQ
jgi:hypothetical protein